MFPPFYLKIPNETFYGLAPTPSLDGEGAEGGWGDIDLVSNKCCFWSNLKSISQLTSNR